MENIRNNPFHYYYTPSFLCILAVFRFCSILHNVSWWENLSEINDLFINDVTHVWILSTSVKIGSNFPIEPKNLYFLWKCWIEYHYSIATFSLFLLIFIYWVWNMSLWGNFFQTAARLYHYQLPVQSGYKLNDAIVTVLCDRMGGGEGEQSQHTAPHLPGTFPPRQRDPGR